MDTRPEHSIPRTLPHRVPLARTLVVESRPLRPRNQRRWLAMPKMRSQAASMLGCPCQTPSARRQAEVGNHTRLLLVQMSAHLSGYTSSDRSSPDVRARATASVLFLADSLSKIFRTSRRTRSNPMRNSRAISRSVNPLAARRRICASRSGDRGAAWAPSGADASTVMVNFLLRPQGQSEITSKAVGTVTIADSRGVARAINPSHWHPAAARVAVARPAVLEPATSSRPASVPRLRIVPRSGGTHARRFAGDRIAHVLDFGV